MPGATIVGTLAAAVLGFGLLSSAGPAAAAATRLYEGDCSHHRIGSVDLDGTNRMPSLIDTGHDHAGALAITDKYVFWAAFDFFDVHNGIGRADLSGAHSVPLLIKLGDAEVTDVKVHGRYVYWSGTGGIGRARLDGTHVQAHFVAAKSNLQSANGGLAVTGRHIYWTNTSLHTIGRADRDGSRVTWRFIRHQMVSGPIATDGSHLFWAVHKPHGTHHDQIRRSGLSGARIDTNFVSGGHDYGAMTAHASHLYYGDSRGIGRVQLNGSGNQPGYLSDRVQCGMAVGP